MGHHHHAFILEHGDTTYRGCNFFNKDDADGRIPIGGTGLFNILWSCLG